MISRSGSPEPRAPPNVAPKRNDAEKKRCKHPPDCGGVDPVRQSSSRLTSASNAGGARR
jgi:hypothetical protein